MATPRLSMSKTKEVLRQKWLVGRSHREVAKKFPGRFTPRLRIMVSSSNDAGPLDSR